MSVAYWMKSDCIEVNSNTNNHGELMKRLTELMDASGSLFKWDSEFLAGTISYAQIFSYEEYRIYTDSFNDDLCKIAVVTRESLLGSTTLRFIDGVVIAAISCSDVLSPIVAAVTIPNGIYFPSKDVSNNPARLFFAVAYPKDGSTGHLKLAYEIEKMLDDNDFKNALINAKSAEEFIKFISDKENGNFSSAGTVSSSQKKSPQNISNTTKRRGSSMAISLRKGQKVDLTKGNPSLTKILVGLGWKEKRYDGGYDFDLDAAAFLLGANGKVSSDDDFVFYNNLKHVSGSVEHMGDELTGGSDGAEGDQEQIKIDLASVPANVEKIDFTVTIYEADERKQTFGQVEDAYIRVVDDATGKELIRYDLGEDFSVETAVVVGEIYRNKGEWKFNAIGSGFSGGLAALGRNFGVNV
ncbi:MAG: TerD family protein [Selenomonadaceae bacterium]|nr:TerD family protein [Selenomonadaceae bacterium]